MQLQDGWQIHHSPHILVNLLSTLMEKAIQIPQILLANL